MTSISAAGLEVRTDSGDRLLADVDLELSRGETVLVAGPSGSGKTLLGKALGGLLGHRTDLVVTGDVRRRGRVGFLFQNPQAQLVRRGVEQDLAFGLENLGVEPATIREEIATWAARFDANHLLDRDVEGLSHGETTLVALLGTVVTEPDVVVLDEPLAPLDERNRRRFLSVLEELQAGETTLVVAEHDARDLLERVDRVLLLEAGRIKGRGPPRAMASGLRSTGVRLPFETEVALERGVADEALPLGNEGSDDR